MVCSADATLRALGAAAGRVHNVDYSDKRRSRTIGPYATKVLTIVGARDEVIRLTLGIVRWPWSIHSHSHSGRKEYSRRTRSCRGSRGRASRGRNDGSRSRRRDGDSGANSGLSRKEDHQVMFSKDTT